MVMAVVVVMVMAVVVVMVMAVVVVVVVVVVMVVVMVVRMAIVTVMRMAIVGAVPRGSVRLFFTPLKIARQHGCEQGKQECTPRVHVGGQ